MTRLPLRPLPIALTLIIATSAAALAEEVGENAGGAGEETLFSLLVKGGWVMIPLAIASIIALALTVERAISLQRQRVLPDGFLDGLGEAWNADPSGAQALQYCDERGGAVGHVFKAGIQWRHFGYPEVSRAIEDAGSREADRMKRSLRGLKAIASVAPLMGLMGTVLGLISAFQETADEESQKSTELAGGIYEALVTTATGLVIAIPTLLVYQYLSSRVDALIDHIDETGTAFIVDYARLDPAPAAGQG